MMKPPKITEMLISCVNQADSSTPAKMAASQPPGMCPTSSNAVAIRVRTRRTTRSITSVNPTASPIV